MRAALLPSLFLAFALTAGCRAPARTAVGVPAETLPAGGGQMIGLDGGTLKRDTGGQMIGLDGGTLKQDKGGQMIGLDGGTLKQGANASSPLSAKVAPKNSGGVAPSDSGFSASGDLGDSPTLGGGMPEASMAGCEGVVDPVSNPSRQSSHAAGDVINLSPVLPNGSKATVAWTASHGTLFKAFQEASWQPPGEAGTATVSANISDPDGGHATLTWQATIRPGGVTLTGPVVTSCEPAAATSSADSTDP